MPQLLSPLPESLLRLLGCAHNPEALAQGLGRYAPSATALFQERSGEPYSAAVKGRGLGLMVQCLNPQAPQESKLWGLHALSFATAVGDPMSPWAGPWPQGLNPATASAQDLVQMMAPAEQPGADPNDELNKNNNVETLLVTPQMCVFEMPGYGKQRWLVQVLFHMQSHKLSQLMLLRQSEWVYPSTPEVQKQAAASGTTSAAAQRMGM